MKIDNQTQYDTRYLRKLFIACEKKAGTNPKHRCVKVVYCKTGYIKGYAWIHSCSVVMKLPKRYTGHRTLPKWLRDKPQYQEYLKEKPLPSRKVAQVYLHEVDHNYGLHHIDMARSSSITIDFWPDESIPLKQIKEKPKVNIIEVRATKARRKLDEWRCKMNRAKTFVKKYQRKVNYYERKMAASDTKSQSSSCK